MDLRVTANRIGAAVLCGLGILAFLILGFGAVSDDELFAAGLFALCALACGIGFVYIIRFPIRVEEQLSRALRHADDKSNPPPA